MKGVRFEGVFQYFRPSALGSGLLEHTLSRVLLAWTVVWAGCIDVPPFEASGDTAQDSSGDSAGDVGGDSAGDVGGDSAGEVGDGTDVGPVDDALDGDAWADADASSADSGSEGDAAPADVPGDAEDAPGEPDDGAEPADAGGDSTEDGAENPDGDEPDAEVGPPENPLAALNDEFEGSGPPSGWYLFHEDIGESAPWSTFGQEGGQLVIVPVNAGWFNNERGPFAYRMVTGDFAVTAAIHTARASAPALPPVQDHHVGGLLARNPAGTAGYKENWVLVDVGRQTSMSGSATKSTTWVSAGSGAVTDKLEQPGAHEGELALCRVGAEFRFYRRLTGEGTWSLEDSVVRADLPETLQVGVMTGAWPPVAPPAADLRAAFDYIRFAVPANGEDCLASLGL